MTMSGCRQCVLKMMIYDLSDVCLFHSDILEWNYIYSLQDPRIFQIMHSLVFQDKHLLHTPHQITGKYLSVTFTYFLLIFWSTCVQYIHLRLPGFHISSILHCSGISTWTMTTQLQDLQLPLVTTTNNCLPSFGPLVFFFEPFQGQQCPPF